MSIKKNDVRVLRTMTALRAGLPTPRDDSANCVASAMLTLPLAVTSPRKGLGLEWIRENQPENAESERIRAEAAALLRITE